MNYKTKKTIIIVTCIAVVLIVYFALRYQLKVPSNKEPMDKQQKEVTVLKSSNNQLIDDGYSLLELEPVTDYTKELNANLPKYFNYRDDNSLINEVGMLSVKPREDSSDVVEKITEYLSDVSKYQIQIAELQMKCYKNEENLNALKKNIDNNHPNISEMSFNEYYFNLGIKESGFCKKTGTKHDIFWLFLKLARDGDEIAQLQLLENLMWAVKSKRFNILRYPLDYMNLRDEAINYLAQLSARGVHRASDKIARLYDGDKYSYYDIIEPNLLLAYYYSFLAVKQDSFEPQPYQGSLEVIFARLSDKQKAIADRMTKNL